MEHDASWKWLSGIAAINYRRVILAAVRYYPWPANVVCEKFAFRELREPERDFFSQTVKYVHKRLDMEVDQADFMSPLIHAYRSGQMSMPDIEASVMLLIIAGSENGAIHMHSTLQNLMQRPDKLVKLTREIRSMYASTERITFESLESLPYLKAVLQENFRMNPPLALATPRLTLRQGGMVCREFIPGGVRLFPMTTWFQNYY
jgi:cytochrome P450